MIDLSKLIKAINLAIIDYNDLLLKFSDYDNSLLVEFKEYYGDTFEIKGWKNKTSKAEGIFTLDPIFFADNVDVFKMLLEARKWQLNDIVNIVPDAYKPSNSNIVSSQGRKINDKRFISKLQDFKDDNFSFFSALQKLAQDISMIDLNIQALPDVIDIDERVFEVDSDDMFIQELLRSIKGRLTNKVRFAKVEDVMSFIDQDMYRSKIADILNSVSKISPQQFKNKLYNFIMNIKDDMLELDVHISRNIIDDIIAAILKPVNLVSYDLQDINSVIKKSKHLVSNVSYDDFELPLFKFEGRAADLEFLASFVRRLDFKRPASAAKLLLEKFMEFNPHSQLFDNFYFVLLWVIVNNKSIILDVFEASVSSLLMMIKAILNEILEEVGNRIGKLLSPF